VFVYVDVLSSKKAGGSPASAKMTGQPFGAYAGGRNEFACLLTEGCYMCFPTMLMRRDLRLERFGELDEGLKGRRLRDRGPLGGERRAAFGTCPSRPSAFRLHSAQQSSLEKLRGRGRGHA